MKTDIYLKIQEMDRESLFEIPEFICNWEYEKKERECRVTEIGKIVTDNYNFRFYADRFKIDILDS